ncbi:Inositol monophosphatase, putative [Perkinsus marinus ATCC 50983]|uniref:Inositol-1-monophosphatase n=1 Tax=Perkinsus marinus (strain ATCC 50983 / TXsc) TaxID=423536 RepID=C5L7A8_PERM5|nr:Inositol monophosphatase, putative [Perkinsus marinus ATCC 50983]EER07370.1 Inositol monophosphatase, putative [Perkinsus marinus ATCC 50983]|eukprot:XP_002775554.1 Inositol monophosphatase, putative [Perkinsus marinus ATCC 50983]
MSSTVEPTLEYLLQISRQAGDIIRGAFHRAKHVDCKVSAADLVTETDVAVERFLIGEISNKFPEDKFLAEESSREEDELSSDPTWIIDPIDGTTNFVCTFPQCASSIAYAVNKEIKLGCVFNPITDEMWYASLGGGAFYVPAKGSEPVRIHTSGKAKLGDCLVSLGFNVPLLRSDQSNTERARRIADVVCRNHRFLMYNSRDIRRIGSAAIDLCYVAMGREDCYFELGIKEWDIAAGVLILSEAGGCYCLINGEKPDDFLHRRQVLACCSEELREEMSSKLEYIDWWEDQK